MIATPTRSDLPSPSLSTTTQRATSFVADHRIVAAELGAGLASDLWNPADFGPRLGRAFEDLADPAYAAGQARIAPGIGKVFGVRWPLLAALERGFRQATRRDRPAAFLPIAEDLFTREELEYRWFAFELLDRLLPVDPERAWQLIRRAAREAGDWITVDTLARPVGHGILQDPYRWAELEQLVYAENRWERRLVGSTIASLPFVDRRLGRTPDAARHGLDLVASLIGDAEPDVQKALSWALRSLTYADPAGVLAFLRVEAERAAATDDGQRAWVIRDALSKLPAEDAEPIRALLVGIRRRPQAGSTSRASAIADRFRDDLWTPPQDVDGSDANRPSRPATPGGRGDTRP